MSDCGICGERRHEEGCEYCAHGNGVCGNCCTPLYLSPDPRISTLEARIAELERERGTWESQAFATLAALATSSADRDEAVVGLAAMRDFYVKRLAGKDKPVCTLCGSEAGTPHGAELGCGRAAALLDRLALHPAQPETPNEPPKNGETE